MIYEPIVDSLGSIEAAMTAVSSSTSQTATTLAQALAKLAADEAAKASTKIIATDQATVTQFENSQTSSSQNTGLDISV
jgi:hypothetical protein